MQKLLLLLISLFAAGNVRADELSLITAFYTTIGEKHAEPITAERLTVNGLQGLTAIDRDLLFADGREMVYLYHKRQQVDLWHKPENPDDIDAWAKITLEVTEAAVKNSPKAAERDFELI